jgi:hypothetical protein
MEDNHFIAHPDGGVTTEAALAEQSKPAEGASEVVTPEVASEPEVAATTDEQPVEETAPEATEAEPETTDNVPSVEPEETEPEAEPAE